MQLPRRRVLRWPTAHPSQRQTPAASLKKLVLPARPRPHLVACQPIGLPGRDPEPGGRCLCWELQLQENAFLSQSLPLQPLQMQPAQSQPHQERLQVRGKAVALPLPVRLWVGRCQLHLHLHLHLPRALQRRRQLRRTLPEPLQVTPPRLPRLPHLPQIQQQQEQEQPQR